MENDVKAVELFFGIVSPVGIDTEASVNILKSALQSVGYDAHHIKLSKQLRALNPQLSQISDESERILEHMSKGNEARAKIKRGDAVALLSLPEVKSVRDKNKKDEEKVAYRNAYIFDSLKHPEEIKSLKKIYGDHFFVISIYEPREDRIEWLTQKISASSSAHASKNKTEESRKNAETIINKDKEDDPKFHPYGQSVRDTFHLADLFVEKKDLDKQTRRFIRLLFGARFITPTIDEYGLRLAQTVALKSADLSRQVGAVVLGDRGELISAGCNEVPQPEIGVFWENDEINGYKDHRDFKNLEDANVAKKNDMLAELFQTLKNEGWLSEELQKLDKDALVRKALYEDDSKLLKDTRINSLLEFGRIVHAEMSAITDAARRGQSLLNRTLYCTTFPCHGCARHIIAAGINKVIFIEPYPKSLTEELYEGMVKIDGNQADRNNVCFVPFIGVAPKKYESLFSKLERKRKNGSSLDENHVNKEPRIDNPDVSHSYLQKEDAWITHTKDLLSSKKS